MHYPLVSVIIPCYNHAQYISDTLDALLGQTYPNLEIIIVDDYSTDNLSEIVQPYLDAHANMRLLKNTYGSKQKQSALRGSKNTDAGWAARNFGVDQAVGEYITFQDADDGAFANRIMGQYELAQQYAADHVCIDWCQFSEERNTRTLDTSTYTQPIIDATVLSALAKKTKKGIVSRPFASSCGGSALRRLLEKIDRRFFRDWSPYPCAGGVPFVKKHVFERCRFRPLHEREWPSDRGRGADRDFNFWVAETFGNSIAAQIPLTLWRQANENTTYSTIAYDA